MVGETGRTTGLVGGASLFGIAERPEKIVGVTVGTMSARSSRNCCRAPAVVGKGGVAKEGEIVSKMTELW